ncbi:hypothetical protein K438DRAFT_1032755 [Mycena galopus ATCC 62051]|nr:hypothetical protein K438DRAFT_1032755 [Mycena galopus ATCC 62051]
MRRCPRSRAIAMLVTSRCPTSFPIWKSTGVHRKRARMRLFGALGRSCGRRRGGTASGIRFGVRRSSREPKGSVRKAPTQKPICYIRKREHADHWEIPRLVSLRLASPFSCLASSPEPADIRNASFDALCVNLRDDFLEFQLPRSPSRVPFRIPHPDKRALSGSTNGFFDFPRPSSEVAHRAKSDARRIYCGGGKEEEKKERLPSSRMRPG